MEVVEFAHVDLRAAPVSERHVIATLQATERLLEVVAVDGVRFSRREGPAHVAAEIAEDEEAKRRVGVERFGRPWVPLPRPHVDVAGRRALGHRGLLEIAARV